MRVPEHRFSLGGFKWLLRFILQSCVRLRRGKSLTLQSD